MAERFVIRDTSSGYYLAEKFMRGYFFTSDINQAIKCKTKDEATVKIDKQNVKEKSGLTVDSVNFT